MTATTFARAATGWIAAVAWTLLCLRWFDVAEPFRPAWLVALPPALLLVLAVIPLGLWLRALWPATTGPRLGGRHGALLLAAAAILFRLPFAAQGAAGFVTADGALSGIVMLRVLNGAEHFVFVPQVPYSGSLKSHLAAFLALALDPAVAFALCSVLFYGAFVAAVYRLALELDAERAGSGRLAIAAALFATFSPVFVTRYSLSNDGNYVEVLAFGTWALALAIAWARDAGRRRALAPLIGLLLGLGFWCHILAVIHVAAIGMLLVLTDRRAAVRSAPLVAGGFVMGDLPGLLWNATNDWQSFRYLLPGGPRVGDLAEGPGLVARSVAIVSDHWPVLLGHDPGNGGLVDAALRLLAWTAVMVAGAGLVRIAATMRSQGHAAARAVILFSTVNVLMVVVALPYIPGNPRYLIFMTAPIAVALAAMLHAGSGRLLLGALLAANVLTAVSHGQGAARADEQWRGLAAGLEARGLTACTTDFFIATKVNFLSAERVICSAKLGPTHTEYFFEYRTRVEQAPRVALVAVNGTAAEKLERRLERLGAAYDRFDLMKPVIVPRDRNVDPAEIFPGRDFPLR